MTYRFITLTVLAILLGCPPSIAQPQELINKFEKRSITTDSMTMGYRLFVPDNYDPAKSYPLVLALHRVGQNGTDNERHICCYRLATSWADPKTQSRWPAFVVAPQLPPGHDWFLWLDLVEYKLIGPREATFTAMAILDSLEAEFSIDPDRIYVTGIADGGIGSWGLPVLDPNRFAATIPMSARYLHQFAEAFDDLPVWIFHGEKDSEEDATRSRIMAASFMDRGRSVLFTECRYDPSACDPLSDEDFASAMNSHVEVFYTGYENGGHDSNVWATSYDDPRLAEWVFAQHRRMEEGIKISSPSGYPTWTAEETVTWDVTDESESGELWLSVDNGESWILVDSSLTNTGSVVLDTRAFDDTPVARIRLIFRDADGFVHKKESSGPFVIDNDVNGAPFIQLARLPFVGHPSITGQFDLPLIAGDAESDSVTATVLFSHDGGATFYECQSLDLAGSPDWQTVRLTLADSVAVESGILAVSLSDGESVSEDRTLPIASGSCGIRTSVEHEMPTGVASLTNHPNPFQESTTIAYTLDRAADVELVVLDILGRIVAVLANGRKGPGEHLVQWNGRTNGVEWPAGSYFLGLSTATPDRPGDVTRVLRSMILAR